MLASCSLGPVDPKRQYSSSEATQVLKAGLGTVNRYHLAPPPLSEMVVQGLRGLSTLDRGLAFDLARGRGGLLVTRGSWARLYPVSHAATSGDWSRIAVDVIDGVRGVSPAIRDARAEQVYELLFDAALAGLDRYTVYLSAREARSNRATRQGYSGIGLSIEREGTVTRVKEVFAKGPAREAGIRKGDIILAIDGIPVGDQPIARIGEAVRGPRGTPVTLELSRAGRVFEVAVTRRDVVVQTVSLDLRDRYAVVRISGFNDRTARAFADAVQTVEDAGTPGLVIDLSGNPGGVLDEAITIADRLLTDGTILSTRGRHPGSHQLYQAGNDETDTRIPLVVLIDRGSASAAEVLAAALRDQRRAVLIGGTTLGKGTVQRLHELPNTGQINVTWARIHSPNGDSINGRGVRPAVCTGDLDRTLDLALEQVRHLDRVRRSSDCVSARGADFNVELAGRLLADRVLHRQLLDDGITGRAASRHPSDRAVSGASEAGYDAAHGHVSTSIEPVVADGRT